MAEQNTPSSQHNDWGSMRQHLPDGHPDKQPGAQQEDEQAAHEASAQNAQNDVDGLADKKPEELTPEELRLMADTMPGEGPGD